MALLITTILVALLFPLPVAAQTATPPYTTTTATPTLVPIVTPTPLPLLPTPTYPVLALTDTNPITSGFMIFGETSPEETLPMPNLGASYNAWLGEATTVIDLVNSDNALWVMSGITMALLVLAWAIEQVKNPKY